MCLHVFVQISMCVCQCLSVCVRTRVFVCAANDLKVRCVCFGLGVSTSLMCWRGSALDNRTKGFLCSSSLLALSLSRSRCLLLFPPSVVIVAFQNYFHIKSPSLLLHTAWECVIVLHSVSPCVSRCWIMGTAESSFFDNNSIRQ